MTYQRKACTFHFLGATVYYAKVSFGRLLTQDKADDMHIGVKSTALKFGDSTKRWLMGFASGVSGGFAVAGAMCHQPWLYFAGVGVVGSSLAYEVFNSYFLTLQPNVCECENNVM